MAISSRDAAGTRPYRHPGRSTRGDRAGYEFPGSDVALGPRRVARVLACSAWLFLLSVGTGPTSSAAGAGSLARPISASFPAPATTVSPAVDVAGASTVPILGPDGPQLVPADAAEAEEVPRPTGRLILKLAAGAGLCLSCGDRRAELRRLFPESHLDDLLRYHGLRATGRLLGGPTDSRRRARLALRAGPRAVLGNLPQFDRTWIVEGRARPDIEQLAHRIAADPAVEYCEPDYWMRIALMPDDPLLTSSGLWGQRFDDLWGVKRIGAPAAWDVTRGAGAVIAIVDTGIDVTHPDIAANVWTNPGEIAQNGIDDDGNGYVDDILGWDFVERDAEPDDLHSHGTHVAGTAAAVGDNGLGIAGVAYESQVMAVRVLDADGSGLLSWVAEGILYAADAGADVINLSLGGEIFSQTLADALAVAHASGTVVVAAAGNSARDANGFFPAGDSNVITVSAFTHEDERADFSNFGVVIDVAAPGGGDGPPPTVSPLHSILSLMSSQVPASDRQIFSSLIIPVGTTEYLRLAGTSMAAPHVAGVAALIRSLHPDFTPEQVRQVLRTTADDVGPPGPDRDSGFGLVDAATAVAAPTPLEARILKPRPGEDLVGPTTVVVEGSANGPGFVSYRLDYRPATDPAAWTALVGPVTSPVVDGTLYQWDMTALADGDYVLRLSADTAAQSYVDRVQFTVRNLDISEPEALAAIHPTGPIEIRGTAAGPGFVRYQVEYRRPAIDDLTWRSDGITMAGPTDVPVRNGLLATLDVSSLTEGDSFDFRLVVEDATGTKEKWRRGIVIDPSLRPGWPQSIVGVSDAEYLIVADLDHDGITEIPIGSGNEVVVFEPDGSVRPGWPQSVVLDNLFVSTHGSPVIADITGDDALEVIAANNEWVFAWTADGALLPGFPVQVERLHRSINDHLRGGDIDGDGKDEIVVSGSGGMSAVDGDGTQITWNLMDGTGTAPAAIADVDGDGRAEMTWSRRRDSTGRGWKRHLLSLVRHDPPVADKRWTVKALNTFFPRVGMADMDGDGRLDVVTLWESGGLGNRHPRVRSRAFSSVDGRRIRLRGPRLRGRPALPAPLFSYADVDRDGLAEAWVYVRREAPILEDQFGYFAPHVLRRRRTPPPVALEHRLFGEVSRRAAIAIGDIDGDGIQELVGGTEGVGCGVTRETCGDGSVRRALPVQHPDGTLVPGFPKPVPRLFFEDASPGIAIGFYYDDRSYATPAIADLDGDGLKEVLWVDQRGPRIFVWNVPGTPGPLLADWPMYHHDPRQSNSLPPTR